MNKHILPLLLVAGTSVVLITGCSKNTSDANAHADHAAKATSADHSTMDHSQMDHSMMAEGATGTAASMADDAKPYPLTTCVVSGEKLGSMGEPQRLVYQGQEMKFCCKDCVKEFQADPQQYMTKLAEAATKPMDMPADGTDHSQH